MEIEQGSQILSISKRGRQLQELPAVDKEEFTSPPQRGLNLRPLLRTIKRKALLIIGITGVVAAGAWVMSKSSPISYLGNFRLLVEPVTNEARAADPSTLTRAQGTTPAEDAFKLDYATQLEILKSPKMLSEIAEKVRLRYPNFSERNLNLGLVVQRYQSKDPQAADPTKLLDVSYQAEDPSEVEFVLKVTADRYLRYSLEERKTRINEGVKFIDEQLPTLERQVDTLQSQLQVLQQRYQMNDPKTQRDQLVTQANQVVTQQRDTIGQLQEQKTLYTNLQKQLELTPDEAIAASALSEDPNYKVLQAKIQELDNQIAVESGRFLPGSPVLQSLQAKRQSLVALEARETQRILGQEKVSTANNPQVTAFQNSVRLGLIQKLVEAANQVQQLEVRNQALAQTRNAVEQRAQQFPAIARQYNEIQGQLDLDKKTLDQLKTQRETLQIEAAQKQYPWQIISPPQVPRTPAGAPIPAPTKAKNLQIAGVVIGLLLGIGVAVLIEKLRNIFYSTEEIKEAIQLPLLGEIPPYTGTDPLLNTTGLIGTVDETAGSLRGSSRFQEAFDALYANIRFLFSAPPVRSLAVCSATLGDGKTTVALHLAQSAASMGQRVLLVDANFRQPQLHNLLGLPNHKGLSDLLAKKLTPNDFIQRLPSTAREAQAQATDNLFVLTSGQPLPNSTKLLGSAQMQYLMEEFQATFDLVIYDTSHLHNHMDANFLAAHTDGLLLVVGVRKTNRSLVMQVLDQLNTFRIPSLGVVANHVRKDTNISYGTRPTTDLQIVGDELPIHHK
jgi:succinoglycan biosynthesis transport protein ExoP